MSHEIISDVTRPPSDDNRTYYSKPKDRTFGTNGVLASNIRDESVFRDSSKVDVLLST